MFDRSRARALLLSAAMLLTPVAGCRQEASQSPPPARIPHGFVSTLQVMHNGHLYRFGPFVGYYFRPVELNDFRQVDFVCFNERGFYCSDVPVNAKLFTGRGVLMELPPNEEAIPDQTARIRPVFFDSAPPSWLATRPQPQDDFLHFHSMYDVTGSAFIGYWLRHRAVARFTYDMGGRVDQTSPLWHRAEPGVDRKFPRIIEFDSGPKGSSP